MNQRTSPGPPVIETESRTATLPTPGSRIPPLSTWVGLVISIVLIWWAVHDVDAREVMRHVSRANWLLFALAVALTALSLPFRAFRWRCLLNDEAAPPPPTSGLWSATAIGFMANNLLPARTGELARAIAVTRTAGVRITRAVASIAIERVLDAITLVGMLCVVLLAGGVSTRDRIAGTPLSTMVLIAGAVVAVLVIASVIFASHPKPWIKLGARCAKAVLPERWSDRVESVLTDFGKGFQILRQRRAAAGSIAWTIVIWTTIALSYAAGLAAFGLPTSWPVVVLITSVVTLGIAVPSSPGFFGPFEAAARACLMLFGVGGNQAVSFAVSFHIGIFVAVTGLGLWCLSRAHLTVSRLREPSLTESV